MLPITVLPLPQAVNLVTACLKTLNATITSTLASNILPSLTSDIWTTCRSSSDSCLSVTMSIVAKDFKLQSSSLEPLPLHDLPHNRESISEMWLWVCADMHGIDNDHIPPNISTDGVFNMLAAGCQGMGWFWIWCIYCILHLMVQAGW